tara:strand:+ start:620 stop:979 length:360 start_codon:yes stop_codon:yes gene_type:complete
MGGKGSGRGTIPGKERNITHLKWEIVYITPDGRLIHQKFKSIKDIQKNPDLCFITSTKLNYYSKKRPMLGDSVKKRLIGHLRITEIKEKIPDEILKIFKKSAPIKNVQNDKNLSECSES